MSGISKPKQHNYFSHISKDNDPFFFCFELIVVLKFNLYSINSLVVE